MQGAETAPPIGGGSAKELSEAPREASQAVVAGAEAEHMPREVWKRIASASALSWSVSPPRSFHCFVTSS